LCNFSRLNSKIAAKWRCTSPELATVLRLAEPNTTRKPTIKKLEQLVESFHPEIMGSDDYIALLSEFTPLHPHKIIDRLPTGEGYFNHQQTSWADDYPLSAADRRMWAQMRMPATDIADVTGSTHTYLANEPGDCAFHCHLLYHMHGGMMQTVTVMGP
jgi:hypothetical protein